MINNNDPRYLKVLAEIADTTKGQNERLDALEELIENWLPENHPYRAEPLWSIYDRLKEDWAERPYLVNGRAILMRVSRPPLALADIL